MDMDTVGIPEEKAFDVYQRFIVRRLRRNGMPLTQALREAKEHTPLAKSSLLDEMKERPVIINRAPVLHRFGIMALRPVLTKGNTLQMSPLILRVTGQTPTAISFSFMSRPMEKAKREALDIMLPSRQLLSPADFKSPVHSLQLEYTLALFLLQHIRADVLIPIEMRLMRSRLGSQAKLELATR